MAEDRNNQSAEEQKSGALKNSEVSKENANAQNKPQDRLKDGTNDFANGDQEPKSEKGAVSNEQ